MRVSFVTTVKNEEQAITHSLTSVWQQSKKPDEIVIVDGGSTDGTHGLIKEQVERRSNVVFLRKVGNRAVGRNEAIKRASGEIIAVSDAGCTLDKDWLRHITAPFKDADVAAVSGYYKPVTKSTFERCLATYTCVMPDKVNPQTFLPSSRSIAFRKEVWRVVGGYPQHLNTCEDLVFAKKIKRKGFYLHFEKNAYVYWPQRKNIWQAFWQFFSYAKGDGEARYVRAQTPFLLLRVAVAAGLIIAFAFLRAPTFLILFFLLLILYIMLSLVKNYRYVKKWEACVILPLLQVTADVAVVLGMTVGLVKSLAR